jgi:hypothetical protein
MEKQSRWKSQKERERGARRRLAYQEQGICLKCCRRPVDGETTTCKVCKAKYKRRKAKAVSQGLCSRCRKSPLHTGKCCKQCLDKATADRKNTKDKVFAAYGGYKCACCGELEPTFLTIDHINNDGNVMRKIHSSGHPFYNWLIKNNLPSGYQILCMNCQFGKAKCNGVCPHQSCQAGELNDIVLKAASS